MNRKETETDLIFRNAREEETDTVLGLYRSSIGTPFCAWDEDYPGVTEIRNDFGSGNLFVLEREGEIIGAISIAPENELDGIGVWRETERAGEFGRVVIRPSERGKGLAKVLVANVLRVMRERGMTGVHISAAKQNLPAQKTYLGFGFRKVGEAELWNHDYYLLELLFSERQAEEGSR